jgi:hypothetical protein
MPLHIKVGLKANMIITTKKIKTTIARKIKNKKVEEDEDEDENMEGIINITLYVITVEEKKDLQRSPNVLERDEVLVENE